MQNQYITINSPVDKTKRSPIVFDTPHSGLILPDNFKYTCDKNMLGYLPDLYVDRLLAEIPAAGAPVLESKISRICIDLNRPEDELDPRTINGVWDRPTRQTGNTETGFGLFPRSIRHPDGHTIDIFDDETRPTASDVAQRIALYHRPYYNTLRDLLQTAHDDHGFAVHCNMHSMRRRAERESPYLSHIDLVLGDLHGQSCHPALTAFAKSFFEKEGLAVSLNDPYQGGNLVRTAANPDAGYHSLQFEMMRDLYMDQVTLEYKPEKAKILQDLLNRFAGALHDFSLEHAASLRAAMPVPAPAGEVVAKHLVPSL